MCHETGESMAQQKRFQDLNLADAYLFAAALEDAETCRLTLEILLGRKVSHVTVHAEYTVLFSKNYHSIRLDIYARDDECSDYNVEMQGENAGNLPKRSRYHQAQMDVMSLPSGSDFNELKPNYVVFICRFDPFGDGLYRYTFTNRCAENGLELGDGTIKIFLNTKGKNTADVPKELVHFLEYVENSTAECADKQDDDRIRHIHKRVTVVKESQKWERKYMTFGELLDKEHREGRQEGLQEGLQRGILLTQKMLEAGEADKISMLSDENFSEKMCHKYGIMSESN